jgi:uncharacterized protein (TIGR02444 family)
MLAPRELTIWDFALAWYRHDGVQADCLMAQDTFGLDVSALIFALYRARQGQGFDASDAAELARTLSARVIEPLRAARTALKSTPSLVSGTDAEALRQAVKAAELDAERLTLDALTRLPVIGTPLSADRAVLEIARAYQASDHPDLLALLKRLALSAQNM